MNFNKFQIIICILSVLLFSSNIIIAEDADVNLEVDTGISPACNQNGICEASLGETEANCPADCGCNNNGVCESARGENTSNCPLDCPVAEEPSPGGGAPIFDTTPPVIFNLFISEITLNSIIINWDTNEQAICQLFLGRTQEYEKETIAETVFFREHSTELTGLSPGTAYHFKIICKDTNRNESETSDQKFTTLSLPDITPPLNISDFEAIPGDKQIKLKWQNPPDPDFKEIKIARSQDFYPKNPEDGVPVYIGKESSFEDKNLENNVVYYYSAFSYDKAGNYSSGAVVSAVPGVFPIAPPITPPITPPIIPPPPEIQGITLNEFDFWQGEQKIPLIEEEEIKLKEEQPLIISIDYEKVPEVLKTIMITLERPARAGEDSKYFSFLLRINKEKTKYLASIAPPEPGNYPLSLHILDFKNQNLKTITGELKIEGKKVSKTRSLKVLWLYIIYIVGGIIILAGAVYFIRRFKKRINANL